MIKTGDLWRVPGKLAAVCAYEPRIPGNPVQSWSPSLTDRVKTLNPACLVLAVELCTNSKRLAQVTLFDAGLLRIFYITTFVTDLCAVQE